MASSNRIHIVFALAALMVFADSNPMLAQGRGGFNFGGGSNNNDDNNRSDNNRNNDNSNSNNNSQGGNRRNRDRDDDNNGGGFRLGGSDAQKVQDAIQGIQGIQGNPGQSQMRRRGQQGQQGQQFNNQQQRQNFQQNNQGNWQNQNQNRRHRHNMESWSLQFGGSRPFSAQWHNDHPQAWHHRHRRDNDAWEVATAVGVLGWLGWGGQPHHVHDTTVVYQPETIYIEGQQPVVVDPNRPGEWMTLGVYSLMTGPADDGTRLVQLAVDKHGHIGGNYYDTVANASHNLSGRIHEPSQQVQWTLDTNKQLVFFTPLNQLTQSQGVVYVKFPSGQQQQWQLVRMEDGSN